MKVSGPFLSLFVFLLTQGVYLSTLDPSFPNDDSPETVTAAVTLGLQHPPGYALAALMDHWFAWLPLGSAGFRVNWGASLLASLGAALLTGLLFSFFNQGRFLSSSKVAPWVPAGGAVLGGLALAFSPLFWQNALSAKGGVYHLTLCAQLLLWAWVFMEGKERKNNRLWASATLMGLGLTSHWETFVLLVPAVLITWWWNKPKEGKSWSQVFALFLIGLSPLLYLPLRAKFDPALNLGDPKTLDLFWADVTRHYFAFREMTALQALGQGKLGIALQLLANQVGFLVELGWQNLGLFWGFLALLGFGLWTLTEDRPKKVWAWVCVVSLSIAGLLGMTADKDNGKFLLVLSVLCFLWAGVALVWVATEPKIRQGKLFLAMAALILLMDSGANFIQRDQSQDNLTRDYGENLLKSLPPNSLFFAESDADYFSLYYLQQVEHQRPDVVMIPAFTLFETWGVKKVEKEHPELGLTASQMALPDHFARIIYASSELVVKNRDKRPIAFSRFNGAFHRYYLDQQKGLKIRSFGMVWLLERPALKLRSVPIQTLRVRDWDAPFAQKEVSLQTLRQVYTSAGIY